MSHLISYPDPTGSLSAHQWDPVTSSIRKQGVCVCVCVCCLESNTSANKQNWKWKKSEFGCCHCDTWIVSLGALKLGDELHVCYAQWTEIQDNTVSFHFIFGWKSLQIFPELRAKHFTNFEGLFTKIQPKEGFHFRYSEWKIANAYGDEECVLGIFTQRRPSWLPDWCNGLSPTRPAFGLHPSSPFSSLTPGSLVPDGMPARIISEWLSSLNFHRSIWGIW